MAASDQKSIDDRIREAFEKYQETADLLDQLLDAESAPEELVILTCARLDALANLQGKAQGQARRFAVFVESYSGARNTLRKISVPDLYVDLGREYDLLPLTIGVAGRLTVYDESVPFLRFAVASGLPLTHGTVSDFLRWLSGAIQRKYRTTATQSKSKPMLASRRELVDDVADALSGSRWKAYQDSIVPAFKELVAAYALSVMLYREVRSGAIHEHEFGVSYDRFFEESEPFFETVYLRLDNTRYLGVQFPGRWLVAIFKHAVASYVNALLASRKLPVRLWRDICDVGEIEYLDEASLPEGRLVVPKVGR